MATFRKKYKNIEPMETENLVQTLYYTLYEIFNRPYLKEERIGFHYRTNFQKLLEPTSNQLTWIGHSTFLIQIDGLTVLTDPIWTKNLAGNKRIHPTPFPITKLPRIDVVLISHGHYDHLDFSTLKEIDRAWKPYIFMPASLKGKFLRRGFEECRLIERNWDQQITNDNFTFTFVPAQHWTRRHLFDKNASHWGGWTIQSKKTETTLYFAGDTAYLKHLGQYLDGLGPIDYALMPIGAYEPCQQNHAVHANPKEAVGMFLDIEAKHFIPMHYGTFSLGTDSALEAKEALEEAWKNENLEKERLHTLKIGQILTLE